MTTYTWENQRQDIQSSVRRFFRAPIDITPRAMAALQTGASAETLDDPDFSASVFEYSVIESLLKSSPACSALLLNAGVDLDRLSFPLTTDRPAPFAPGTLEFIFRGVEAQRPVRRFTMVRKRRVLEETDILVAALEASLQGEEPNEFGGRLLRAAGLEEPGTIRDGNDPEWEECNAYLSGVVNSVRELAVTDPSHALQQFLLFEDNTHKIRIRPFGATGLARVHSTPPLRDNSLYLYRGGQLQPAHSCSKELSQDVLGMFEELLNAERSREADFQRFFEQYPFLLTGMDFSRAHPQPILHSDDSGPLIPDFFLERLAFGWDAILDLKRPYDEMVSRRPNRTYFKQNVQNAVAQLRYYREWFDSPANRRLFAESYGVSTFRPRMVIVIGRRHHFLDDVERIRLVDGLPQHVDIWTYDDLYQRAKRYLLFCDKPAGAVA